MRSFDRKFDIKRPMTPNLKFNHKLMKNQIKSNKKKSKIKVFSKYFNSNAHLNELIEKIKCFKDLLYQTNDLKSLSLLDVYGLKYTNELKQILNNVKSNIFPIPQHYDFSMKAKEKTKKNKNNDNNRTNQQLSNYNSKSKTKKEENFGDSFDLTSSTKYENEKTLSKKILNNVKKNTKLMNLKAQILLLDKFRIIRNKKENNIEFLRNNIKKYIYNRIKSKYKRPKTADIKSKNNLSKISNNNISKGFSKISDNTNYSFGIIKPYKLKINNKNKNHYTPNILLYKGSKNPSYTQNKNKYKKITSNDNSQDYTVFNFPSESSLNKSNKYNKRNINLSQRNRHSLSNKTEKKYFYNKLNNVEAKTIFINENFTNFSNESQELGYKLFNKTYKNNKYKKDNEGLDIKEINKYFNFSEPENNIEDLLKKNAKNVKRIMDPKCGKILDQIVKEVCLEENILNKNYFLSFKLDKSENKTKILNKYNSIFKKDDDGDDNIFKIFQHKEEDFFNIVKSNKNYVNDIEHQYLKAKVINYLERPNNDIK
jgi:hypothetical protein